MKELIKFLIFIIYTTSVFFFPNNELIFIFAIVNIVAMIFTIKNIKKVIIRTLKIFPFILLTFLFNWWLDNIINALWIGAKLIIVCNITMCYATTTTTAGVAETIRLLCTPLKIFKVNTDEIKVMVCISLTMIPILRKELNEMKDACKAKGIKMNLKNIRIMFSKFFLSLIMRVNNIEEALIAKGHNY